MRNIRKKVKEQGEFIDFKNYFSNKKSDCKKLELNFDIKCGLNLTSEEIYDLCYKIFSDKSYGKDMISQLNINLHMGKKVNQLSIKEDKFYKINDSKEIEEYMEGKY